MESMLKKLKDESIIGVWLNDVSDPYYPTGIHVCEMCDRYYSIDLTKEQAQQMVNELQALVNKLP